MCFPTRIEIKRVILHRTSECSSEPKRAPYLCYSLHNILRCLLGDHRVLMSLVRGSQLRLESGKVPFRLRPLLLHLKQNVHAKNRGSAILSGCVRIPAYSACISKERLDGHFLLSLWCQCLSSSEQELLKIRNSPGVDVWLVMNFLALTKRVFLTISRLLKSLSWTASSWSAFERSLSCVRCSISSCSKDSLASDSCAMRTCSFRIVR